MRDERCIAGNKELRGEVHLARHSSMTHYGGSCFDWLEEVSTHHMLDGRLGCSRFAMILARLTTVIRKLLFPHVRSTAEDLLDTRRRPEVALAITPALHAQGIYLNSGCLWPRSRTSASLSPSSR